MPFPEVSATTQDVFRSHADAVIVAIPPLSSPGAPPVDPALAEALESVGFTGAAGSLVRVHVPGVTPRPLFVVGTGTAPVPCAVRDAVATGVRAATGFDTVAVSVPDSPYWRAAAEGAAIGGYRFADYKSAPAPAGPTRVHVHTVEAVSDEDVRAVHTVAEAVALVRDLSQAPASTLGPGELAQAAVDAVAELPVDAQVYDEQRLRTEGFGGILGVGQGSARPPRLVRLDYSPAGARRHVELVGKGITFDSGGLSLKPPAGMIGMKDDMTGAATALAVVRAAARLALPVRVGAWLCIADNMPSGSAIRPGDVLTTLGGTTVEVLNTDAEGRLVLADGLVAASRQQPDVIIDIATLTGAIGIALGTRHTGVFGDDEAVADYLRAADRADELAWPMPLPAHMEDELDSPIADLRNAKVGDRNGGALFAGLFLQRFVGRVGEEPDAPRIPWVHLDIAASAVHSGAPDGVLAEGPTGASVRSLLEFLGDAQ